MITRPLVVLLSAVMLSGCVSPLKRAVGCGERGSLPFLDGTAPPPAVGSPEMRRQLREIRAMQAQATPMRLASARWTYDLTVFTYSLALGPSFTEEKYPKTGRLFRELNDVVKVVNTGLKKHFKAPHPFQVDPGVKRFVIAVPGADYPSYHSARCTVFQHVLAMLDPARADAFRAVSLQVENDRIFAGEHFPFSVVAGRNLGERIFAKLNASPEFHRLLEEVRAAEWREMPDCRNSFAERVSD